tara:strand:- start:1231 stop:1749 length:519 start_codon:yes stop_codon:yes gene_type:complete
MKQGMVFIIGCLFAQTIWAASLTIEIKTLDNGTPIGTIMFEDTQYGLLITPKLKSIRPGLHGLHIHQHASCDDAGQAAGGHLDPNVTRQHLGPYYAGHAGDLPALYVDQSGAAQQTILAPRLRIKDIENRSVMIHQGPDNYLDKPLPMGGGAERMACGVILVPVLTGPLNTP